MGGGGAPTGDMWSEASQPDREADLDAVAPGTRIGRYEVRTTLGRGGMGVVLLARDAELDRYVALKLVRGRGRAGTRDSLARDRLVREAQAMARLSHPNVITVHDVGTFGERVFVAMEFVRGATLTIWLQEKRRAVDEIVRVFVSAARGLAAAHAAGLVHRDFKPDNVMIADPEGRASFGRVLVLDFGLARAADGSASGSRPQPSSGSHTVVDSGSGALTQPGFVVGTPAYMAPEQHHGDVLPASDQFALCVSLFEALFGQRPYRGRTLEELARRKRAGVSRWPSDPPISRALREVLRRGLSPEPDDRFETMAQLVDALDGGPARRARRRLTVAGVVALGLTAGTLAAVGPGGADPCPAGDAARLDQWDDAQRDAVQAALLQAPAAYAGDTARVVLETLDGYADELVEARHDTCLATRVERTQSEAELDVRMACLGRRARDLGAVATVLAEADAASFEHAIDTARALTPVARCGDLSAADGTAAEPLDAVTAARVAALEDLAGRAKALTNAGRYDQAKVAVDWLQSQATSLQQTGLRAEADRLQAELLHKTGEYEAAAEADLRAIDLAAEVGDDRLAVQAWEGLTFTVGHSMADYARAERYARHYEAAVVRLGSPDDLEAQRQATLGILAHDQGRLDEAQAHFETAISLHDADEVEVVEGNLARTLAAKGDLTKARALVEKALAAARARYGSSHPQVAKTMTYLGMLQFEAGDVEAARKNWEEALAIQTDVLGPDHPDLALSLNNVANALGATGDLEGALDHYDRARAILVAKVGPEHPNVARLTFNMAELHKQMGHQARAKAEYERTVALMEKAFGREHVDVGRALNNLGSVEYDMGQYGPSLEHYTASLRIVEKSVGADYSGLGYPLTGIGLVHIADGRPAEAIAPLRRSLEVRAGADVDPVDRADTQYALARALWAADRDRDRALQLGRDAIAGYDHASEGVTTNRAEAVAWLAERGVTVE